MTKLPCFKVFILMGLLFLPIPSAQAQNNGVVWPGDINNDGLVDGVDLIYWGLAYDSEGDERPLIDQNIEWYGHILPEDDFDLWDDDFPGGPNFAFADCDGDGLVEDDDIEAIEDNFGLTHGVPNPVIFNEGVPGIDPPIQLESTETSVQGGQTLSFSVNLGNASLPITDFYGILFSINYDTDLVEEGSIDFQVSTSSWIDLPGSQSGDFTRSLAIEDATQGKAKIAISRFNQNPVDGFGQIGNFTIVIVDNVNSLIIDSLDISIDSIKLLTPNLGEILIAVNPKLLINPATSNNDLLIAGVHEAISDFELFPNPAHVLIRLDFNEVIDGHLRIIDVHGKMHLTPFPIRREKQIQLDISHLPPGVYWIYLHTSDRTGSKRFVKME